jgi:uncharacterized protein (TIGR02118 family)
MIKLVYCITKKSGLSDEEFFHYWRKIHGPIGARIPGLRRLVQSHTIRQAGQLQRADYDGMAELWFDDMAALVAAQQTVEWQNSSADEANFIEPGRVAFFITQEHEIG